MCVLAKLKKNIFSSSWTHKSNLTF